MHNASAFLVSNQGERLIDRERSARTWRMEAEVHSHLAQGLCSCDPADLTIPNMS